MLVAVLIVTVLLALAAYNYTNWGVSEYRLTVTRARQAQAKASADSAVHYFMAMMANPEDSASILNGNVFDNPPAFLRKTLSLMTSRSSAPRFPSCRPARATRIPPMARAAGSWTNREAQSQCLHGGRSHG